MAGVIAPRTATAQPGSLEAAFRAPPISARPWVRWWWPGGAVEDAELRREIDILDQAGFGGGEIQPFNPGVPNLTPAERTAINDYATPSFFAHVGAAVDQAARRGLHLDYTFGSAWPSGGGHAITPELALLELGVSMATVTGGQAGPVRIAPPKRTRKLGAWSPLDPRTNAPDVADWPDRLAKREKIVAVVAARGAAPLLKPASPSAFKLDPWSSVVEPGRLEAGSALVLTDRLRSDGTLDWRPPPGQWQVLVFKQYAADSSVSAGVGAGPQLVLDHFQRAAFDAHARRVGDAMVPQLSAAFGKTLRAAFVDSLELMPDLYWSEDLLQEFKRRRGYDLTPYLPLIIQPGWVEAWSAHWSMPYYSMPRPGGGDLGARVREDYHKTVSELLAERFVEPFVDWNHDHGLEARFQAHGAPSDTLRAYGLADIPETEDLGAGGDLDFLKLARSAGDIYGRREISAESWCWPGRPYSVTPEELKRRSDFLFAGGVNRIVAHGFPYASHPERWPGWHAFPPGFGAGFSTMLSETNPIWAVIPALTTYVSRAQAVLQSGDNVVPVAVFMQDTIVYEGHETKGQSELPLLRALLASGYDYDRLNTDGLVKSHVEHGALVTPGGHRFFAVVLPKSDVLDLAAAEALARFAREGLKVVFVDANPSRSEGLHDARRRDLRLRQAVAAISAHGGAVLSEAETPDGLRRLAVPANLTFDPGVTGSFVERSVGDQRVYFFRNPDETEQVIGFTAPVEGGAQLWDAWTGEVAPIGVSRVPGGRHVKVTLKPGASAFVVFGPDLPETAPQRQSEGAHLASLALDHGWTIHAEGHGGRGRVINITRPVEVLGDLRDTPDLSDFSGAARYSREIDIPATWLAKGRRVRLHLEAAQDAAIVTVNGQRLTPLVVRPFVLDVTAALHPGANHLQVETLNTPENAMAANGGPAAKYLPTKPAGLLGPVALEAMELAP